MIQAITKPYFNFINKWYEKLTTTQLAYTGIDIVIPAKSFYVLTARAGWNYSRPLQIMLSRGSTLVTEVASGTSLYGECSCTFSGYTTTELKLTVWTKYDKEALNPLYIQGVYMSL